MKLKTNLTIRNFTKGRYKNKIPLFLVFHYTANDGDTDEGNANYFKTEYRRASAHYFCDENSITQVVRDEDTAWHCGDNQKYTNGGASVKGTVRNNNSIGIEMCSDVVNGEYVITKGTQENAIELGKLLMKKYTIPIENVYRHYDVTGKICPAPFVKNERQWKVFKEQLIQNKEDEEVRYERLKDIPNNYGFRDIIEILMNAKVINGDGSDATGNDDIINLSHDQVRSFVMEYRGGAFDRKLMSMGMQPAVNA